MTSFLVLAGEDPGDFLASFPLFYRLKSSSPLASVWVAGPQKIKPFLFDSYVHSFIALPTAPRSASFLSQLQWAEACVKTIRAAAPQLSGAESFALKSISQWGPWLQWRLGSTQRHAWGGEVLSFLANGTRVSSETFQNQKISQTYWEWTPSAAQSEGLPFWAEPASDPLDPHLSGVCDVFPLDAVWTQRHSLPAPDGNYWVLAPGASEETRQWPWERYLELARQIYSRTKLPGLVIGTPQDALQAQRICSEDSSILVNRVAMGGWVDYCDIIRKAQFVIASDSPFAQLSLLLGRYTHIVWGARNPQWAAPSGLGRSQMSFYPAPCWPCSYGECPLEGDLKLRCLRDLSVQAVADDLWVGLSRYLPGVLDGGSLQGKQEGAR